MNTRDKAIVGAAAGFARAAEAMARLNRAFELSRDLDELRRRAEHFATPRWQRPYWRLRVRFKLREIARNA